MKLTKKYLEKKKTIENYQNKKKIKKEKMEEINITICPKKKSKNSKNIKRTIVRLKTLSKMY